MLNQRAAWTGTKYKYLFNESSTVDGDNESVENDKNDKDDSTTIK